MSSSAGGIGSPGEPNYEGLKSVILEHVDSNLKENQGCLESCWLGRKVVCIGKRLPSYNQWLKIVFVSLIISALVFSICLHIYIGGKI